MKDVFLSSDSTEFLKFVLHELLIPGSDSAADSKSAEIKN
jgi:hypothetical protein